MSVNLFSALRTVALRDVLKETPDYQIRSIFRWYSKTFHVPLPEVSMLPMDDVLQAFYEVQYEEMEIDERESERQLLIESDDERTKRLMGEALDEFERVSFEQEADRIAESQQKDLKDMKQEQPMASRPPVLNAPMLSDSKNDPFAPPPLKGPKVEPGITMKFVTDAELKRLIEEADRADEELDMNPSGNLPKVSPDPTPRLK